MNNVSNSFGQNLRKEINRKRFKYQEAADAFDISLSFLNQLMKGTTTPSLEVFRRIVDKLGISADALMYGDDTPVEPQDLDPSSFTSVAQIAAALTELNKKFEAVKPSNELVARISVRLAALNDDQLGHVDGFIDDLLASQATVNIPSTKIR